MVKIALQIQAFMENVTGLQPADPEDYKYFFKFKCSNCAEVPDHWQHISLADEHPLKVVKL